MNSSSNVSSPSLTPVRLRDLEPADRAPLERILRATGSFHAHEVDVALELIDDRLARRESGSERPDDYRFLVAHDGSGNGVAGYVCFGLSPLTDGVFDLYWIAVDPRLQRSGVGRALLGAVEGEVKRLGGRMLLVETGGKPSYAPTRAFYERAGYGEIARIPDFFQVGDDKVVYARRFDAHGTAGFSALSATCS